MAIPMYGQNKAGSAIDKKTGTFIHNNGAQALTLTVEDSGATILISGGTNGATACDLPSCIGVDGLEFTFLLTATNGTGDWDIDAKDGTEFFIGSITSVEGTNDVGIDFNGSSHDQCTLAASKGAVGDIVRIISAGGKWYIRGTTNDQDGWAVGTGSANT